MASRPLKRRTAPQRREIAKGSIEAAVLGALRRLVEIEGSVSAVARSLGFRRARVSGWLSRNALPAALRRDAVGLEQLLQVLANHIARWDVDGPRREQRDRRIQKNQSLSGFLRLLSSKKKQAQLKNELGAWVARFEQIADFRRSKSFHATGLGLFAAELQVRVSLLREGLGKAGVGPKLFYAYEKYRELLAQQAAQDARDVQTFEELYELSKEKAYDGAGRPVPTPSEVRTGDHAYGGDGTSGWWWKLGINRFAVPTVDPSGKDAWALVERMAAFVRGIPPLDARRFNHCRVLCMTSLLVRKDVFGRRGKLKYGDAIRQLGHERSRDFVSNEPHVTVDFRGSGARERAVRQFIERMGDTLDGSYLMKVQGVIGWQFRLRTARELELRTESRVLKAKIEQTKRERLERARARKTKKKGRRR